ncbi:MAG: glycosyltransferase family 4 protein [Gemmatimonadota bacterium]|nr:glycosyltransferase family 4 protein [Gemmatimonadota bacterium]
MTGASVNGGQRKRIAIVAPELGAHGGVQSVAWFLYRVIRDSGRYDVDAISLAMSWRDPDSVRLLAPRTWLRSPRVTSRERDGLAFRHVGAVAPELERRRYRPRRALTELLEQYDLVQLVSGSPAIGHATEGLRVPVALQIATTMRVERKRAVEMQPGFRGLMTRASTSHMASFDEAGVTHARLIFTENAWLHRELSERYPGRVRLAPPGIDTERYRPGASPAWNGPILAVARLNDPRKNLPMLFDAYARLRARMPQAPRLMLAGQFNLPAHEAAMPQQLGIAEHVDIRYSPTIEELIALYQSASCLALSSDEEGLGIVILEAMASGLPVVATGCGGPDDVVIEDGTGYLVPVKDAAAMAERLAHVLSSAPLRARLGAAGRERAVREYSIAAAGRRFLDAYDTLLEAAHA